MSAFHDTDTVTDCRVSEMSHRAKRRATLIQQGVTDILATLPSVLIAYILQVTVLIIVQSQKSVLFTTNFCKLLEKLQF